MSCGQPQPATTYQGDAYLSLMIGRDRHLDQSRGSVLCHPSLKRSANLRGETEENQ